MTMNDICRVLPCKNIITKGRKGIVCGTHQWRKRKYDSYDLPNHKGMPSFLCNAPLLDIGVVKQCDKHGKLTIKETYPKHYKGKINSYNCKKCLLDNNIKRKYQGMKSLEDYDRMLLEQNESCAICKGQNNTTRNNVVKRFNIDHCHKTGKTRGLLCSFCNSLLGYAKDNEEITNNATKYLRKYREQFTSIPQDVKSTSQVILE